MSQAHALTPADIQKVMGSQLPGLPGIGLAEVRPDRIWAGCG